MASLHVHRRRNRRRRESPSSGARAARSRSVRNFRARPSELTARSARSMSTPTRVTGGRASAMAISATAWVCDTLKSSPRGVASSGRPRLPAFNSTACGSTPSLAPSSDRSVARPTIQRRRRASVPNRAARSRSGAESDRAIAAVDCGSRSSRHNHKANPGTGPLSSCTGSRAERAGQTPAWLTERRFASTPAYVASGSIAAHSNPTSLAETIHSVGGRALKHSKSHAVGISAGRQEPIASPVMGERR